ALGEREEHLRAKTRLPRPRSGVEDAPRGGDRGFRVIGTRVRELAERLARAGIHARRGRAARRRPPLTVDPMLRRFAHWSPPMPAIAPTSSAAGESKQHKAFRS